MLWALGFEPRFRIRSLSFAACRTAACAPVMTAFSALMMMTWFPEIRCLAVMLASRPTIKPDASITNGFLYVESLDNYSYP